MGGVSQPVNLGAACGEKKKAAVAAIFFSRLILPPTDATADCFTASQCCTSRVNKEQSVGGLARVGVALRVAITLPRLLFCSLDRFSITASVFMERCLWKQSAVYPTPRRHPGGDADANNKEP